MTTFGIKKGDTTGLERLFDDIRKWVDKYELVISTDQASGNTNAPSNKKPYYKSLPFAIHKDTFTQEGNNRFVGCKVKAFALFFLDEGSLDFDKILKRD